MTFDRTDLSRLWLCLLSAVLMLGAGAALVMFSAEQLKTAQQARARAISMRAEFNSKLQQVSNEETEVRDMASIFNKLRTQGIVGEEDRLVWIELIKEIIQTRKLLNVEYEFTPQEMFAGISPPGYKFNSSFMRLRMKLLHEGDLINFIRDLRQRARAYVRVRSCAVDRMPDSATGESALLSAECELEWITLEPVKNTS